MAVSQTTAPLEPYQQSKTVPYKGDGLQFVLDLAYAQAMRGKGAERHAYGAQEPFEDQLICEMDKRLDGNGAGPLYQAVKKIYESRRLPPDKAREELLGAINYIAAAILVGMDGGAR